MNTQLKEYIALTCVLLITASVLRMLVKDKLQKTFGIAVGFVLISAVMLPLVGIIRDIDINSLIIPENESVGENVSAELLSQALEEGIGRYIEDEYGVEYESVEVKVSGFSTDTCLAESIYIRIENGAQLDFRSLREDIRKKFTDNGRVEVRIDA